MGLSISEINKKNKESNEKAKKIKQLRERRIKEKKIELQIEESYDKKEYIRCYYLIKELLTINKLNKIWLKYFKKIKKKKLKKLRDKWATWWNKYLYILWILFWIFFFLWFVIYSAKTDYFLKYFYIPKESVKKWRNSDGKQNKDISKKNISKKDIQDVNKSINNNTGDVSKENNFDLSDNTLKDKYWLNYQYQSMLKEIKRIFLKNYKRIKKEWNEKKNKILKKVLYYINRWFSKSPTIDDIKQLKKLKKFLTDN